MQALLCLKLHAISVYDNIVIQKPEKRKDGNQRNLYVNLNLKYSVTYAEFTAC